MGTLLSELKKCGVIDDNQEKKVLKEKEIKRHKMEATAKYYEQLRKKAIKQHEKLEKIKREKDNHERDKNED